MTASHRGRAPSVCFVGLENLPVLAREYERHPIGGEQVQHTLLARALARHGYAVSMVVGDYGQADGACWDGVQTFKAYRADAGLPIVRFAHPRWSGLWRAVHRANADVYYVSCAGMSVGEVVCFARRHGRRVIFRIASDSDCEPDALLIARDPLRIRYWLHRRLYLYGLARADAILAQSERQRERLRRNLALESTVAPLLVEQCARGLPAGQRDVQVLWVANLRRVKRPDLALALARRLPARSVHLVGGALDGHGALFAGIRREAEALANVRFHGRLSYHATGELFERARVLVNTSEVEGFPNTFLQAWARGTPVVSFLDPDGLIEREGLGRRVATLEEMVSAVNELLADCGRWSAASERCRAFMAGRYAPERVLEPYVSVIERLAAARYAA